MTTEEINKHLKSKEMDTSYPRLPKFIKENKNIDKALQSTIIDSFYKRLDRYNKNKEYQETNKI